LGKLFSSPCPSAAAAPRSWCKLLIGASASAAANSASPSRAVIGEASLGDFITDASDPRLSLIACPGRPDCGSAFTSAPADALRLAEACPELLKGGANLHVSGCPKGCAHPGKADLTLVGRHDGRYDIVANGSTRDASSLHLSIDEIMSRLSPLNIVQDLPHAFPERTQ
jgi:precorrin-3B synthase